MISMCNVFMVVVFFSSTMLCPPICFVCAACRSCCCRFFCLFVSWCEYWVVHQATPITFKQREVALFLMCFYLSWSFFRIRMHHTISTAMIQIQCLRIMVIINMGHDVLVKWLPLHLTASVALVLHIMPA